MYIYTAIFNEAGLGETANKVLAHSYYTDGDFDLENR